MSDGQNAMSVTIGQLGISLVRFGRIDGQHEFASFPIQIESAGLSAAGVASSYGSHGELASFFRDLAASWRGWEGARRFDSLEHELTIEATSGSLGHISLDVTLRGSGFPPPWSVATTVVLEAGEELSSVAQAITELHQR